jgi:hypothetical protein
VDVDATGTNFTGITGLTLGTFTIGKITPAATYFDFAPADAVYDGSTHGATVAPLAAYAAAGLNIVEVKYEGTGATIYPLSATAPTDAGTYAVRITTAESANFAAITDLTVGAFTIAKAEPTAEHFDITADTYAYYTGDPRTVDIPALRATYAGLGEVTVKYNGSATPPIYPGEYVITLDIAEGANFAAVTGLPAGRLVISEHPTPIIRRKVTLDVSPHFASSIAPGSFYVESYSNLTFVLTPLATLPDGYEPKVTTDRSNITGDNGGVQVTRNADGTYTVRIAYIIEETVITVRAVDPATAVDPVSATRVWSYGNRLYITAPATSGRAYIYNTSGMLVKIVTHTAGETAVTLLPEAGIYVVVVEGRSYLIKN